MRFDVKIPVFNELSVNIMDFGGINDGVTYNTDAFKKAIEYLTSNGGGTLIVPRGIFYTGPIELKSNINLHLQSGSVILFSDKFDDYPLIDTSFEGFFTYRCISPIYCKDSENVAITGNGVIEGNGQAWRPMKKFKLTERVWNSLVEKGGVLDKGKEQMWWPTQNALDGHLTLVPNPEKLRVKEECEKYRDFLRPALVNFTRCKKILLQGVTFQNSPAWCLHPWLCEDLTIKEISVRNPWFSQNGDGLDVDSCKNVLVTDSTFDVGDDALCIKSGKNEDGRKLGVVCENVEISNCTVYHGHGGFVVGSEMSGGVKNIYAEDLTFIGTDTGIRFKSCIGRGGLVENVYCNNINMTDIPKEAIIFTMGYDMDTKEGQEVSSEEIPEFRNIEIKNVLCTRAKTPIHISGLSQMPVHNISFENVNITSDNDIFTQNAEEISFKNVNILK